MPLCAQLPLLEHLRDDLWHALLYSVSIVSPTASCEPVLCMQVLALELLMILLENSGEVFRTSEKFSSAIKQYLCLSLLKNCTSSIPQAFALSCSIFLTLMAKFRHSLKAEIGVFFPMIMLKAIEAPQAPAGTPFGESTASCALALSWHHTCQGELCSFSSERSVLCPESLPGSKLPCLGAVIHVHNSVNEVVAKPLPLAFLAVNVLHFLGMSVSDPVVS